MTERTILIADDEPLQRELLSGFLRKSGYATLEAADGVDAVARVRAGGIDLVLLDQRMPRLDGPAALKEIRAADPEIDVTLDPALFEPSRWTPPAWIGARGR